MQELTIKPSNYAFLHFIGVERRYPLVHKQFRRHISTCLPRKILSSFCHTFARQQNYLLIYRLTSYENHHLELQYGFS